MRLARHRVGAEHSLHAHRMLVDHGVALRMGGKDGGAKERELADIKRALKEADLVPEIATIRLLNGARETVLHLRETTGARTYERTDYFNSR